MAQTFSVPQLGEGVDAVDVVTVLVEVGETVEVGQPVMEVETDKASVEVPSTVAGVIEKIHIDVGDSLTAGDPVLTIEEGEAAQNETAEPEDSKSAPATAPKEVPEEGAPPEEEAAASPSQTAAVRSLARPKSAQPGANVPASPTVRRFAREVGIDITQVTGTGPEGRLTLDDVKDHARHLLEGPRPTADTLPAPPLPDFSKWGETEEEAMSKVRRLTAERMDRAWRTIPQVTHNDSADVTELDRLRKRFKGTVEEAGGKLTVTAILVKIAASALRRFPEFNSSIDTQRQLVIRKKFVNVGVAVDTPRGLLVPVIKDADTKNVKSIAIELNDLATRARERKLMPEEMQGATFSISNLGGIGGTGFSPIVNWPEVAILGVSRGQVQASWNGEGFEPRTMLPLSLTYDHRLIDGAQAARFLRWVAEALEEPMVLVLEG